MATSTSARPGFRHQCCVYGTDAEFLAMAVPFAQEGLRRAQPVLVTTTSANLDLLHEAMGRDAGKLVYAESAYFGRRPPQLAHALHRYWSRHQPAGSTGVVRVLTEPARAGGSRREVAELKRMEAGFNVVLADTGIWMICPYDTRSVEAEVIEDARRTHPESLVGRKAEPSGQFMAPEEFETPRTSPRSAGGDDVFRFEGDLVAVRRHVLDKAGPLLRSEKTLAMFGVAVGEAIAYLLKHGIDRAAVWVRPVAGRVVCTLHSDQPLDGRPFFGFRPPNLRLPDDSLGMANRVCEWLDISSDAFGCTIELAMAAQPVDATSQVESEGSGFGC